MLKHVQAVKKPGPKDLEVHEEVHCVTDNDSNRRIDIIAINRKKKLAEIIDPTIRFEISNNQPQEVNIEKKTIYEPRVLYFLTKYNLDTITVTGFFFVLEALFPNFLLFGVS